MAKPKKDIIEYRNYALPVNFPVILLSGDRWHISDVKSGRLHFHNCLEIGICHSDGGIMEFYGSPTDIKAGDITCVPRNLPHTTYSKPGMAGLWTYLFLEPEDLFKDFTHNLEISMEALQDFPLLIVNKEENQKIHFLLSLIIDEMNEQKANYRASIRALLLSLCIEFLRLKCDDKKHVQQAPPENALVISPALDYIRDNYATSFTIDTLAGLCHLSGTHFRRVFNSIMGTSPLDFVNRTRIHKACLLMRSTEQSILSISEQVGFRSISSFNRYFAKMMELSPSAWRKQILQPESKEEWKKQSILEFSGWV